MSADVEDLAGTYGALLLGGLVSATLTGVVFVQGLVYYKVFPSDTLWRKLLVLVILLMDLTHSAMVWAGIWVHLISLPRTLGDLDFIPLSISLSIVITAALTFLVHMFFAERIHTLNPGKWRWCLTMVIIMIAAARLGFACATSAQMIIHQSFAKFVEVSSWTFTLGLGLSSAVDLIVTVSLFVLLKENGDKGYLRLGHIIDALVLYTVEIGSVTCGVTIVSMICWLVMRHNLVFLGLHFAIGKLYANSLLATLNTRRQLRHIHSRMINEMDASAIVREDLRLHFRTPMTQTMNTILEENLATTPGGVDCTGQTTSFLALSKAEVGVSTLPADLENARIRERVR